jgi:hypothetical protein
VLIRLQLTIDWLMKNVCNQTTHLDWQKAEKDDGQIKDDGMDGQSTIGIVLHDDPKAEKQLAGIM